MLATVPDLMEKTDTLITAALAALMPPQHSLLWLD
jgi:hypothetical protein